MTDPINTSILKLKRLKWETRAIAKRLGISEVEVERRFAQMTHETQSVHLQSYNLLVTEYTRLCHQYQLLGESLKRVSLGLSNIMTLDEVRSLIDAHDPEQTLKNLSEKAMVFRPYVPPTIEEELENIEERN